MLVLDTGLSYQIFDSELGLLPLLLHQISSLFFPPKKLSSWVYSSPPHNGWYHASYALDGLSVHYAAVLGVAPIHLDIAGPARKVSPLRPVRVAYCSSRLR